LSPIRYRYIKKPINKVPIRYRYRYIGIGDISTIFSIYRPTSTLVYQISSKSDYFSLRCGDLTIFKMAAVRHLGFVMTLQYCITGHTFVVQILSWNFMSREKLSQNGANLEKWGSKYQIICSQSREGTSLRGTACFGVFCVKIRPGSLAYSELQEPKIKVNTLGARSHACAETKPLGRSWRTFAQV